MRARMSRMNGVNGTSAKTVDFSVMRPSASGVFVTNFRIRDRKYDVIYREIYIPHNKDVAMTAVSTDQAMTFLCKAADVPENGVLRVIVAGCVPLAVYNLDGAFYAT